MRSFFYQSITLSYIKNKHKKINLIIDNYIHFCYNEYVYGVIKWNQKTVFPILID